MAVTVTFTIIFVIILVLTSLVVRSNIRMRRTVSPEKKIDLRVGKDAVVQIRENEEGNIRIDISNYGEKGIPASAYPTSAAESLEEREELQNIGFQSAVKDFQRADAQDLMQLDLYPRGKRREILERLKRNGSVTDEQYQNYLSLYGDCDPEVEEDTPQEVAPEPAPAPVADDTEGHLDDFEDTGIFARSEKAAPIPVQQEPEQTPEPPAGPAAAADAAMPEPISETKKGLDAPEPNGLFDRMFTMQEAQQ